MKKRIVFVDMDQVLADFNGGVGRPNFEQDPPEMFMKGFFRNLKVLPGARWGITELLKQPHLDVYIGSKPTSLNLHCASEKFEWIQEHFPELLKKMMLICDKHLLRGDVLIDDDLRWKDFPGHFVHFDHSDPEKSWRQIVALLSSAEA